MRILLTFVLLTALAGRVDGQALQFGDYEVVDASYHKFVLPGEASVTVLVLGSSGSGGLYEVGRDTDLGMLWALSGGSTGVLVSTEKRKITMRLYRPEASGRRSLLYEAALEEFLVNPGAYPVLADGDIFVVETVVRQRFDWRVGLQILTSVAALTLAAERLFGPG